MTATMLPDSETLRLREGGAPDSAPVPTSDAGPSQQRRWQRVRAWQVTV
jgi:hypothetical protein